MMSTGSIEEGKETSSTKILVPDASENIPTIQPNKQWNKTEETKPLIASPSSSENSMPPLPPPPAKFTHPIPYMTHTYPTTLSLILMLHILFFYQWNKRKTRRDVSVTYRNVVNEYQFHRAFLAMVSYPPCPSASEQENGDDARQIPLTTSDNNTDNASSSSRYYHRLRTACKDTLRPFLPGGTLSGLPLLLYTCHLFWSMRAVEEYYTSLIYLRLLFWLIICNTLIHLGFTHFCVSQFPLTNAHLLQKPWCTMTSVLLTLIIFYTMEFPHASLPVLPFLYTPQFIQLWLAFIIFSIFGRNTHFTSVQCAIVTFVILYPCNMVSFLVLSTYWSLGLLFWVFLFCILSWSYESMLPCIDYVSWLSPASTPSSQHQQQQSVSEHEREEDGEEASFLGQHPAPEEETIMNRDLESTGGARSRAAGRARSRVTDTNQGISFGSTMGYPLNIGSTRDGRGSD